MPQLAQQVIEEGNRGKGVNSWCAYKHLSAASMHTRETLEKLYREVDRNSALATVIESDHILVHLIEAEDHLMTLVKILDRIEAPDDVKQLIRDAVDNVRLIRQLLVEPMVKINDRYYSLPLIPVNSIDVEDVVDAINDRRDVLIRRLERIYSDIERLREKLRPLSSSFEQEYDTECIVCDEDVVARVIEKLRKGEVEEGLTVKPNPDPLTDGVVISLLVMFTGYVISHVGYIPSNRTYLVMRVFF